MVTNIRTRMYKGHLIRYAVTKYGTVWNLQDPDNTCLHKGTCNSPIIAIRQAKGFIDECLREGISSACS